MQSELKMVYGLQYHTFVVHVKRVFLLLLFFYELLTILFSLHRYLASYKNVKKTTKKTKNKYSPSLN